MPSDLPATAFISATVNAVIREDTDRSGLRTAVATFIKRRWTGDVGLGQLLIRDTLIVASAINLLGMILALLLYSMEAPSWVALLIFLLPLPYNVFLFSCIWRLSGRVGGWRGALAAATASLWLLAATII